MNAVARMAALLAPEAVRRVALLRASRFESTDGNAGPRAHASAIDLEVAHRRVLARWGGDLCGFLNALSRKELGQLAGQLDEPAPASARSPALRARLWQRGAAIERGDADVTPVLQPRPALLGGHLVVEAAPRGLYPASAHYPRAVPAPAAAAPPLEEPDSLDELLGAADRALGVRLGPRGRDKGAWGARAQALLGIHEKVAAAAPDWRGDVEIKTIAIARDGDPDDPAARWRIVDDPAIAMIDQTTTVGAASIAKLQRTLWLARADVDDGDAALVSWYLLEWDAEVARLARRYLHVRPKGPAGTDQRALYLHKRFFADAGLLATLNGPT